MGARDSDLPSLRGGLEAYAVAHGGSGPLLVATAHLDAAAIDTLFSIPTELVAAPGVGRVVVPVSAFGEWKPGAGGGGFYFPAVGVYCAYAPGNANIACPIVDIDFPTAEAVGSNGVSFNKTPTANARNRPLLVLCAGGDPVPTGPIITAAVAAGGAGYAVGDTGTVDPDLFAGDATYVVTAVAPVTGAVTAFTVTDGGAGYSTADNPLPTTVGGAQPGAGSGFTVNVTTIPPPGDLYVTVLYQILDLH